MTDDRTPDSTPATPTTTPAPPKLLPGTGAVDLSSLGRRTPATTTKPRAINPLGVPSRRSPNAHNPYGEDIAELTPAEMNEAAILTGALMKKYSDKMMTESTVRMLENEARSRFAEELGLVVSIDWEDSDATVDADPNSDRVWFQPTIAIEARVDKHTVDFDEISHQVRAGEADGVAGVIRNGEMKEDARKKNVF